MRRGLAVLALMIGAGWITASVGASLDRLRSATVAQTIAVTERLRAEADGDRAITEAKEAMDRELAVFDRKITKAESQIAERKGSSDKTAADLDEKIDRLISEKASEENPRNVRKLDVELGRLMRQRDAIDIKPDAERDRLAGKIEALKKDREEARASLQAGVTEAEAAKAVAIADVPAAMVTEGKWWRPLFGVFIGLALLGAGIVLMVTAPKTPLVSSRRAFEERALPTVVRREVPSSELAELSELATPPPEEIMATMQDVPPPVDVVAPVAEIAPVAAVAPVAELPRLPSQPPALPEAALSEAPISQIEAPADVAPTIGIGTPLSDLAVDLESTMDVRIDTPQEAILQSSRDTELVSADQLPVNA